MAKLMWSATEAEGTLYSKCINGKEPHWDWGGMGYKEDGRRVGVGVEGKSGVGLLVRAHKSTSFLQL